MARMDRYKLVLREQGKGADELYDLKADPGERTNRYEDPQFLTVRNSLGGGTGRVAAEILVVRAAPHGFTWGLYNGCISGSR